MRKRCESVRINLNCGDANVTFCSVHRFIMEKKRSTVGVPQTRGKDGDENMRKVCEGYAANSIFIYLRTTSLSCAWRHSYFDVSGYITFPNEALLIQHYPVAWCPGCTRDVVPWKKSEQECVYLEASRTPLSFRDVELHYRQPPFHGRRVRVCI